MTTLILGGVTTLLASIDLWCKSYVEKHISKGEEKLILKEKVSVRKVYNEGMVFNLGDNHPGLIKALSGVVCGLLAVYSICVWTKGECIWNKFGAAFALSGAISNTYDRFVRKHVVDYFAFHTKWKKLSRITFNLGDMFIFLGSAILLAAELFGYKK